MTLVVTCLWAATGVPPAGADDVTTSEATVGGVGTADPSAEALAAAEDRRDAAEARLQQGLSLLARATSASWAAEARVARAEGALVPLVLDRRTARAVAAAADGAVAEADAVVVAQAATVAAEQRRLDDRVTRAYKYGSALHGAMALTVVRNASTPNELVRNLHDLAVVADDQRTEVVAASVRLARALEAASEVRLARDRAVVRAADADRRLQRAEDELVGLRRLADDAEARWLRVAQQSLAAEEAADTAATALAATLRSAAAPEASAPAPVETARTTTATDPEDASLVPTFDERRGFLHARATALARARALDPVRRLTRDDLACPVDGGTFTDDWHFPRSDDRRHEGTDVFAARGTPVRAVVDAVVTEVDRVDTFDGRSGDLGGITITYAVGDERWYAAHLSEVRADLEPGVRLLAGEVIGWVGDSGNAAGTPPHLHLGWYVADTAVNPYASLAVACGVVSP